MKVFLTGSTGYIGSAVARALLRAGHAVTGLARSAAKAERLRADGMSVVLGDLGQPDTYLSAARACDALIHAGFEAGPCAAPVDWIAARALSECARDHREGRLFLYTSGVWVLGPSREAPGAEDARPAPPEIVLWRPAHERLALAAADRGARVAVVRPGCVYGEGGGLYGLMFRSLYDDRVIRVVGSGRNAWASVYLDDLAELYRLVLEKRPRRAVYHAVDGSADAVADVAEAFADAAGGADVERVPLGEARRRMGPVADALAMDQRVSGDWTRRELGWRPVISSPRRHAALLLAQWRDAPGAVPVA